MMRCYMQCCAFCSRADVNCTTFASPEILAKIQHKGVTGNIAFDDKGDIKDGTLTLYTYKGGKRELLAVTK